MSARTIVATLEDLRLSRRRLLQGGMTVLGGVAGAALLARPISALGDAVMPPRVPAGLPAGYDPEAHRWAMACDPSACIGCSVCVEACRVENSLPGHAGTDRTWVERRVTEPDGSVSIEVVDGHGEAEATEGEAAETDRSTATERTFVPRLCMQCENPPCVSVCPVGATFRTADGVVLTDQDRCIGCGYCVVACPYGARSLVPEGPRTPTGNAGVVDKCTFCYHRITRGLDPACVEVCPVSARVFGDLADAESPVSRLLRQRESTTLQPELGTKPQVFYLLPTADGRGGPDEEV